MNAQGIDVSALSQGELKRLAEVAQGRGQKDLAQRLRAELDLRALDDPDPPAPRAPPPVQTPGGGPMPLRTRLILAATMVAAVSGGVGWALTTPRPRLVPLMQAAKPAPRVATAAVARTATSPAPVPIPNSNPSAAPQAATAPPLPLRPIPPPAVARPHPIRAEHSARAPAPARRPPPRPRRITNACRAPASEADRLVCAQPALAAQDRRMRAAYDRALAAGADRLIIDRGQARWREARDRAASEARRSELYARRIAELEAAARNPPRRGLFGR